MATNRNQVRVASIPLQQKTKRKQKERTRIVSAADANQIRIFWKNEGMIEGKATEPLCVRFRGLNGGEATPHTSHTHSGLHSVDQWYSQSAAMAPQPQAIRSCTNPVATQFKRKRRRRNAIKENTYVSRRCLTNNNKGSGRSRGKGDGRNHYGRSSGD